MRTDFNYPSKYLVSSVVFRPSFNNFEKINLNQAWSLFFTAGQEDKVLGTEVELGKFFTNILIAVAVTGTLWGIYFNHMP